MGKCIGYTAGAVTFMGIGALVTGLTLYFAYPQMRMGNILAWEDEETRMAQCTLVGAEGFTGVSGTIHFMQNTSDSTTEIYGNVQGLTAGPHGFHIHEFGGIGNNCKDAGGHFNPDDWMHGGPDSQERHVGDLGNIASVGTGSTVAEVEITDHLVTLYGDRSVLGRALVIHAGEDDLGASGDSAGAAGARVACCPIYIVPNPDN